ncbi:phosphoribosyltransferase family protein [Cellulomonas wangsupingiae]|uniref:phosphoribosyltransferase family protein n=1 Tax=Cellulomonas wangsupingiae TaxID=2968085 RepID=UPI001D0E27AB|nr:phosphoribosyltransferase family protein [Cellulomonas wangsupingiae]MCM0639394.1 adenine phosphoribosyltransferase [Cellulomonas wangsupingiae]
MNGPLLRADGDLRADLRSTFGWLTTRDIEEQYADVTGWWRSPAILPRLGPALAELFADDEPTVVLGLASRGCLLGPLVAVHLGVGFVEVRKDRYPATDADAWLQTRTPPDYHDQQLDLGLRRELLRSTDRVLLVDDWVATGGQALGARSLVERADASWVGLAVLVDALTEPATRRDLRVRSLVNVREL